MENQSDNRTPEEKRKDTSAPGREGEVIVNTQEQSHVINMDDEKDQAKNKGAATDNKQTTTEKEVSAEKTFKEGLANNSDTEALE